MHVSSRPSIDPRRPITGLPPVEEPRIVEQRRAVAQMWTRLKADARLAAIMLNPIFAPHAHAITVAATGRAIARFETEVPRKSLEALMREEHAQAREQIMALPRRYAEAGTQAAQTAGAAVVAGAVMAGDSVVRGTEYAVDRTSDATGSVLGRIAGWLGRLAERLGAVGKALVD